MIWELLYCVMFFVLPIVGMFTAIAVKAFGNDEVEVADEIKMCANGTCVAGMRSYYHSRTRPCECFNQEAVVIDFYAYREWGIIRIIKRRMYARDGPKDTS